jgi:gamma-polyglutamate biosynthesis protein CapC
VIELLPLSVGMGLAIGLIFTEVFGIASGGLIVPGYVALFMTRPLDIIATVAIGYATFITVRTLATFLVIYGRRRTAMMILVGYVFGMLVRDWAGFDSLEFAVIGFVIPGLIATWMDRQGVVQTIASLTIVSTVVRLALVLFVGDELFQ